MGGKFTWEALGFGCGPRIWGFRTGRSGHRRRQWFGAGDMKYVILKLLRDKPRHGYEVMKELEERMHGCYSPSPGTVYPTLQWLEDEGLVVGKDVRSEEHTSELQSPCNLVCRLLLEKKKKAQRDRLPPLPFISRIGSRTTLPSGQLCPPLG